LKLLIAGNLANYGYFLTKCIREYGVNAHLLMEKYPIISSDPKQFESNLIDYPSWIKFWDNRNRNWKFQIIREMRNFDLIQSSTELPIFGLFSGKSNISFATGSDIIELAQKNTIKGRLLRIAYRKSKAVIFSGPYMYDSIKKIKIKKALFIPQIWDFGKFSNNKYEISKSEFIIFHPTSHIWKTKGNDIFIKSFIQLAKKYPQIHLQLIRRGIDFQKTEKLLKEKNMEKRITIIPNVVSQNKLIEYYNKSNVIVDQFKVGSTGLIGLEAMACEKPLIQFINEDLYKKFYQEMPPILNANTEEKICVKLSELIEDNMLCKKIGKRSKEWLMKYHSNEKTIKKFIYVYDAIYNNTNILEIKDHINAM